MLRHVARILPQYMNPVLVETGTYEGDGVVTALSLGFSRVISIELVDGFFDACRAKFASDNRVTIIHGDSAIVLWDAIKDVDDPITFWLDGHPFPEAEGQSDGRGIKVCPLIEELNHIARHHVKNHIIMIDDMSSLPKGGFYKTIDFNRKDIEDAVMQVNGNYKITYFDRGGTDVLIARC